MNKELRPSVEEIVCDVCGRTMLKGERAEPYLAPGGQRMLVCELCTDRAYAEGWIMESAHSDLPASKRRHEPRRSILTRLRRRREPVAPATDGDAEHAGWGPEPDWESHADGEIAAAEAAPQDPPATRPKDPRRVHAIPTNAQVKVERAIEVFNSTEHPRTIAGIARSLGEPWVNVTPIAEAPSEVSVVVAWELSWYHYRVDLGTEDDPVSLMGKGVELEELEEWP